jgi:GNAT superfamily N-acetyltransferase
LIRTGSLFWLEDERRPALYVRRIVVGRSYAGLGLGAVLLDWAADVAMKDHGATQIRIDVWTTNLELQAYYVRQGFTRRPGRDPGNSLAIRHRRSSNEPQASHDRTTENCSQKMAATFQNYTSCP